MKARRRSNAFAAAILAPFLTLWTLSPAARAEGATCQELVRQGRAHEGAAESDRAATRYAEAIAIDSACGPAWLGLAAIRHRQGDPKEAARILGLALRHLPELREASLARARALRAAKDAGAEAAMLWWIDGARSPGELTVGLRDLARWYAEDGRAPAQLAVWRRLLALAEAMEDEALAREARIAVRALVISVGPLDPVARRDDPPSSLPRNVMARIASGTLVPR